MRAARARHAAAAVVITAVALLATGVPNAASVTAADIRAEADWIMSARFPDGAIAHYPDKQAVWPYLANFAAMGLSRATEVTGDRKYVEAAWQWLAWYQAHMDAEGFVTDYSVQNGVLVSTGFMDSTDAYAGTFLSALLAAYAARPDTRRLRTFLPGIEGAVRAIEATQDGDGLTWAKPTWKAKYLMDQAETYDGLLAAEILAKYLKKTTLARRAGTDAAKMRAGVATLWNTAVGAYDWAKHEDGRTTANRWNYLYSDSLQQAWAAAYNLVPSDRVGPLVAKFNLSQPHWASPLATALFDSGTTQTVGYWPVAGWGFRIAGDPVRASAAAESIRTGAATANRAWPYTTGNAGQLLLLQSYFVPNWLAPSRLTTTTAKATTTTAKATTTTTKNTTTTTSPPTTTTTAKPTTTTTTRPTTTTTSTTTTTLLPALPA